MDGDKSGDKSGEAEPEKVEQQESQPQESRIIEGEVTSKEKDET